MPEDTLILDELGGGLPSPRAIGNVEALRGLTGHKLPVTLHALRHMHASQLIDAGVDVVTISKRLGHASPAITLKVYAHLFQERDSKAADAINRALGGTAAETV